MNRRRGLAIIAAVVLTLIGTFAVIAYINAAEQRAQDAAGLEPIVVARQDIPAGTRARAVASDDLVSIREAPPSLIAGDAIRVSEDDEDLAAAFEDLGNQVATQDILRGQPLVERQFGRAADAPSPARGNIREGREVISLALEPQRALGGDVSEDDLVGVIASFEGDLGGTNAGCAVQTGMLLSKIRVTNVVGGASPDTGEGAGSSIMVTLDVDEESAETLAYAAEYGTVWLTRQTEQSGSLDGDTRRCNAFDVLPGR